MSDEELDWENLESVELTLDGESGDIIGSRGCLGPITVPRLPRAQDLCPEPEYPTPVLHRKDIQLHVVQSTRPKELPMNIEKLNKAMEVLVTRLKGSVKAYDCWASDIGIPLVSTEKSNPAATAMFNSLLAEIHEAFLAAQFPTSDELRYVVIARTNSAVVLFDAGAVRAGALVSLDSPSVLGVLVSVVVGEVLTLLKEGAK